MSTLVVDAIEDSSAIAKYNITLGTEQTLSGATTTFSSIPSGVKKIAVMVQGASHNDAGNANITVTLGDSGGIETTGYLGSAGYYYSAGQNAAAFSTQFPIAYTIGSGAFIYGTAIFTLQDSTDYTWTMQSVMANTSGYSFTCSGAKTLSAELDRLAINTTAGSFDNGVVSIQYEF